MEEIVRCGMCQRVLKSEKAKALGFGRVCLKKYNKLVEEEYEKQAPSAEEIAGLIEPKVEPIE